MPVSPYEQQHRSTSPRRRRWNSFLSPINRDSVPPASPPSGEGQPSLQHHSIEDLSAAFETLHKESPKPGDISSSPFFLLEEVWNSLYSWYDLLDQEVQRLPESASNTAEPSKEVSQEQHNGVIPELTIQTSVNTVPTTSLGNCWVYIGFIK